MAIVREDYREHARRCAVAMLNGENLTPYEFCVLDKSRSTHRVMETVTSAIYRNRPAQIEEDLDVTKLMADCIRKLVSDILYYSKDRVLLSSPDHAELVCFLLAYAPGDD